VHSVVAFVVMYGTPSCCSSFCSCVWY